MLDPSNLIAYSLLRACRGRFMSLAASKNTDVYTDSAAAADARLILG